MKAIEYRAYGKPEVLKLIDVQKPQPKDNEVLVKIHATTVTATECTFRKGEPYFSRLFTGLSKPKINRLGEELSGKVEAIGKSVTKYKVGDQVFGTAGPEFGANAEYITIPEDGVITIKPSNLSHEEAASCIDGFLTALPFLRDKGQIKSGQKVLIYGASGSVGSAAVQVAKYFGAHVTAVCSTTNLKWVKAIGADITIDYKKEDFTLNKQHYDIIFDTVGKTTYSNCRNSLTQEGLFLEAGIGLSVIKHVILTSIFGTKKVKIAATGLRPPKERLTDLKLLRQLLEEGSIMPVIDKKYTMNQIIEAHRYVDKGHKKGNVVIMIT